MFKEDKEVAGKVQNDLTNQTIDNWFVKEYIGKSKYNCVCNLCNRERVINKYFLERQAPKCECITGKSAKGRIDLTGQTFGDWTVIEYAGNKKWKCKCSCGTIRDVSGSDLRNGRSTGCRHSNSNAFQDLTGQTFGEWTALEYLKDKAKWKCRCSCGNMGELTGYQLKNGLSKSCGHNTTGFIDLTGKQFGDWHVIEQAHSDNDNRTYWVCRCTCGKYSVVDSHSLKYGLSKSCGCKRGDNRAKTELIRYGVRHHAQIGTTRTESQLKAVESRENLLAEMKKAFKEKPTIYELTELLGISRGTVKEYINKYDIADYVKIGIQEESGYEKLLQVLYPCNNVGDRTVLDGKEIDLYYPELQFGIEFNGNYWHSELKKDRDYHKNKSLLAMSKGVRLFHIFEYEWNNQLTREKIKHILSNKIYGDRLTKIYARMCTVQRIENTLGYEFADKYHLQNRAKASVTYGCYYKNNLIGIMSFGAPRFNSGYEWELIRLCWRYDVAVVGGTEKLFAKFLSDYNPNNILSYCDITKFDGNIYKKLGFNLIDLTEPNYKWVNIETNEVKSRYEAQARNLGDCKISGETEKETMNRLGYTRIYDCGNFKFVWYK